MLLHNFLVRERDRSVIRWNVSPAVDQLRKEFREWLSQQQVPSGGGDSSLERFVETGRAWQSRLAQSQWVAVHWPKEFGGRGLSLVEEAVVQEELVRASSPQLLGLFGLTMVGPVLIAHGSKQQKERYLRKILTAEEVWCQGFSEPGAGSDLAAVRTKAERTDGGFLVTGQKTWTSFAHVADWCFALCRTSEPGVEEGVPKKSKHEGLTYLLIDMKSPGISTRPLQQISGDSEFNEVFFDRVFVPDASVVGEVGKGWSIALSTLMYERVVLTFARQLQSEVLLRSLLAKERELSTSERVELAENVARATAVRALAYEHLDLYASGASPGPEGSMDKLLWSESFQDLCKFAVRLTGIRAAVELGHPNGAHDDMHRYLYSRGRTIAAGTSEIQRSIIAERLLKLPRLSFGRAR